MQQQKERVARGVAHGGRSGPVYLYLHHLSLNDLRLFPAGGRGEELSRREGGWEGGRSEEGESDREREGGREERGREGVRKGERERPSLLNPDANGLAEGLSEGLGLAHLQREDL